MNCDWCDEPILPDESTHQLVNAIMHKECFARAILGSIAHLRGTCACYGGDEDDPPGMTKREAARMAASFATFRADEN